MILVIALIAGLLVAAPAEAAPVVGAVLAGIKAIAAFKIGTVGAFLLRTAAMFALSALARVKQEQPKAGGVRTDATLAGEGTPGSIVIGKYATAGSFVCPPMSDTDIDGVPNAILTYVIELGDAPYSSLDAIWIGDEKIEILSPSGSGRFPDYHRAGGAYADRVWFKFFDGSQTTAYQGLIDTDGNGRPWQSDMIGRGIPYVVMRFQYDRELFQGFPSCLFEVTGIGLYDPRKDSTVGGTGLHRWGSPATYEPSENVAVQVYNILRGIVLLDGSIWGGAATAEDLPLSSWFAEMNKADALVGGDARFRASYEIKIGPEDLGGDEPAEVIETLLRGCNGEIAESGGIWKIRLGGPGLPVAFFSDDDVIVTEAQNRQPFPGLQATYNGVQAQYPEPAERWANKEAPLRYDADLEAADDGHRLIASIMLPATPYRKQVQRVQRALLKDERRFLAHDLVLPPDYGAVEVLDCVGWASEENGYGSKSFSVPSRDDNVRSLLQRFGLRETDPSDYGWQPDYELPDAVGTPTTPRPAARQVLGFGAEAAIIADAGGMARRAAIRLYWNPNQPDARGLRYQIRVKATAALAVNGSISAVGDGELKLSEGILPATVYEVRGRLVTRRTTTWTAWTEVETYDVGLGIADLPQEVLDRLDDLEDWMDGSGPAQQAIIDLVAEDLDAIRETVTETRTDLAEAVGLLEQDIADHLGLARAYTDTSILSEQIERQSATDALAARVDELTAALVSDDLISNGSFVDGGDGMDFWTRTGGGGRGLRDPGSTDPLTAMMPAAAAAHIPAAATIRQMTSSFDVGAQDRLQVRFSGGALGGAARTVEVRARWFGPDDSEIMPPATQTLTVQAGGVWRVLSARFDPPDTARGAEVRIRHASASGSDLRVTKVQASIVNAEIEARVAELEAATVTTDAALALHKSDVSARFGANEGRIATEEAARATAVGAVADRVSAVEVSRDQHAARIATTETAIINADQAIAAVDETLSARAGAAELVRDPVFARGLTHWPAGTLGAEPADIIAKDGSGSWVREQMPALRALLIRSGSALTHYRGTGRVSAAPGDVFDVSLAYARASNGVQPRITLRFYSAALESIDATQVIGTGSGAWLTVYRHGIVAPSGTAWAQVEIRSAADGPNHCWVSMPSARRRQAADHLFAADIEASRYVLTNAVEAMAVLSQRVESNWNSLDGRANAAALALDQRYTKAQADTAISTAISAYEVSVASRFGQKANASTVTTISNRVTSVETVANSKNAVSRGNTAPANPVPGDLWFDTSGGKTKPYRWTGAPGSWVSVEDGDIPEIKADLVAKADLITQVRARTDRASALGRVRMTTVAAGAGAQTRISVQAQATAEDTTHGAAYYMEARTDGTSKFLVHANDFAIVTGSAANASRQVPFIVRGGEVRITELFVDRLAVADRAVSVWEYAQTAGGINSSALDDVVIQTLTLAKGRGEPLPIFYSAVRDVGGTDYVYLHLYRGATRLNSVRMGAGQSGDVHTYIDTWTGSGAVTYTLRASVMRVGDPADIRLGGSPITQRFLGAFNVYK